MGGGAMTADELAEATNWFPDPISIAWLVAALVVLYIVIGG